MASNQPQITSKLIWTDFEIAGSIYVQLCHLDFDTLLLDEKTKEQFFTHAASVMHKLHATKYHLKNYQRIEKEQKVQCKRMFAKNPGERRECLELIFELEAFLYQVKSSLDMLAKLLDPVLGKGMVGTHTYAKKGNTLLKGLKQYLNKKDCNEDAVNRLMLIVEDARDNWIQTVVEVRDKVNHVEGLKDFHFEPNFLSGNRVEAIPPKFGGVNTKEFLEKVYLANVTYHQDFICHTVALIAPRMFELAPITSTHPATEDFGEAGKYLRWSWNLIDKESN